jgi:hypothetical protein
MTGQVIITDTLVEHIRRQITNRDMQLQSLGREDVVTYLKTNLHWRVTDVSQHGLEARTRFECRTLTSDIGSRPNHRDRADTLCQSLCCCRQSDPLC